MSKIILIETSTSQCSTAIVEDGVVIASRESNEARAHASLTAVFIQEMLNELGINASDCSAVCVCAGPGSYTGLRVGSSSAKGLCFGANLPLIALRSTDVLVQMAFDQGLVGEDCRYIVPMIDARRMEVYCATYAVDAQSATQVDKIEPVIVDFEKFKDILSEGKVLFIGDGAEKCRDVIASENAIFVQTCPHAKAMAHGAEIALKEKKFEDTAYFEPFYLKEYVATISRKKLF